MAIIVIAKVTSPQDLGDFIDLPSKIYAGMSGFEAPLRMDRNMLLDPDQSAFWKRAKACYWLARKNGRAVGRISAQVDDILPVDVMPGSGMFGCLDVEDDPEVTAELIDHAEKWLREQGCTSMFGPCTLDMNDEPGLLVEGSEESAMTLFPWHPPYLGQHLDRLGLIKLRDLHSWRLDLDDGPVSQPAGDRFRIAERIPGLRVRHADRRNMRREIQILCDVYNDGWRDHWGFIPLTETDLAGLDQLIKWLVPREAFRIVELEGRPIGVMLLVPNLFELTRGISPQPNVFGWIRLIWRALTHRFESGRIIVAGIARDLQSTVMGSAVAALLVDELIKGQAALHGQWVEAGWVLENNSALVTILQRFGFRRNKTFRIYSKPIKA